MGLLKHVIAQSMLGNKEPFWGTPYSELNRAEVPDIVTIRHFQLSRLKNIEEKSRINQQGKRAAENLNNLFINGDINSLSSEYEQNQNNEIDKAITNIVEKIGDIRQLSKGKMADGSFKTKEQVYNDLHQTGAILTSLSTQLTELKNKLNINSPVYAADLDRINNLIALIPNYKTFGFKAMKNWMKMLNLMQGELVEILGTNWLNERIPQNMQVKAYTTGSLSLNTLSANRHRGQLIQDIIVVDMQQVDLLKDVAIDYTLGGKSYSCSLMEFLNKIESHSGSEQIVIDDNTYDNLLKISQLNIQAKSGKNQLPWNVNKSTAVKIGDFSEDDGRIVSVKRTFTLLSALDEEQPKDLWVNNTDSAYNALANYGVGTMLEKVLHLNGPEGNQFLLTPSGFITYTERMRQIFEKNSGIFKVRGQVTLRKSILEDLYYVSTDWIRS